MKSPFKFLDSFTKEDKNIFFGRDNETEELYQKVFESKVLLVYGVSGTGKSSLIHCGLANKFEESDWLPINIRRGNNINESLYKGIKNYELGIKNEQKKPSVKKLLKNIYLDHFKPIYLIFDQFEELFIFGSKSEREDFIETVKTITESELNCKFMFVIREEYLAGITEFEKHLPEIMHNRIRLEKMTRNNAVQVIEGPCKVAEIKVEEGFSEALLNKLSPDSTEVELTYLQVYLDKLFKQSPDTFTISLLQSFGDVKDLLGSFLDEQIAELETPDEGLVILKAFVSTKGTKRQITEEEVQDYARTLGKNIDISQLKGLIQKFVALRILRDKDESNRYELRHDALAAKIYEKITLVEKELLEIRQFIENAYDNYQRRKLLLSKADLSYIAPYEDKIYFGNELQEFLNRSKREVEKAKRRKRFIVSAAAIALIAVFAGFTWWAIKERSKAEQQAIEADKQKNEAIDANKKAIDANKEATKARDKAELAKLEALKEKQNAEKSAKIAMQMKQQAEIAKNQALNAKDIAVKELYSSMKNSLSVELPKMNVIYIGVDNPLNVAASGISSDKFIFEIKEGSAVITSKNDGYVIRPKKFGVLKIQITGTSSKGDKIDFGVRTFRVKRIADPMPFFAGMKGGIISRSLALSEDSVYAEIQNFSFDMPSFKVSSFAISAAIDGYEQTAVSNSNKLTLKQKKIINKVRDGKKFYIENVNAIGLDGIERQLGSIAFKIKDSKTTVQILNILDSLHKQNLINDYYDLAYDYIDSFKVEINIEIFNKFKINNLVDPYLKKNISMEFSDLSFELLKQREFQNSLEIALIAQKADSKYKILYTNLALAYLLTNDWENAKIIYLKYKDDTYGENYPFKKGFLEDLKAMEELGVNHPDFAKVRELLKEETE